MTGRTSVVHAVRSAGFAGVERHIAVLARAQAELGHRVTVIGGDRDAMAEALQGTAVAFLPGETLPTVVAALTRVAPGCDVVHVHMTAAEVAGALVSLGPGRGRPLVTTRHFAARRGQSRFGRLTRGFVARRVRAQIAISRYVADKIDGASEVVHPGVDPVDLDDAPRDPTVLVVQRLEREKRTDVAVDAFARSGLAGQGWRLRIAGDGALRADLEGQARDLGVADAVDFLGRRSDVARLMAHSGMLLAPCPIEGLGLGVLEAMAARLPVVAAAAGGHLETLPAEAHPYCFPANDPDAAAAALARLAGDPALRDELAATGLQRQRASFTPAAQAEATASVYRAVLAGSKRPA